MTNIRLLNCKYPGKHDGEADALHVWVSPDEKYAVAEVFRAEYFVAGRIVAQDSGVLTIDCSDSFSMDGPEFALHKYEVDWNYLCYGFCQLRCRNLEEFTSHTHRIYFDPELYKQKYEELNGVAYHGNKKF